MAGIYALYRAAGAERWPALTAPVVIAVTLAECFVLEAVLSVIGLFTLCDRHSWTLLIVQVVLTLAVPLGGAIAARVQHAHWA